MTEERTTYDGPTPNPGGVNLLPAVIEANTDLIQRVQVYADNAAKIVVSGPESYAGATEALQEVRTLTRRLDVDRTERTKPLLQQKRDIDAAYKPGEDALKKADFALLQQTSAWRRQVEEDRRKAEVAAQAKAQREREAAEARAREFEEKGNVRKADEWERKAQLVAQPVIPDVVPEVEGVTYRKTWKFEVVDKTKLPAMYLIADEKTIGGVVRAQGGECDIPGIRVWPEDVTVARDAR
jgi:hypothetical protein